MPTLEQTIRELQREILAGLRSNGAGFSPSGNLELTPERVTLSLALDFHQRESGGKNGFSVATDPSTAQHRVSVEFQVSHLMPVPVSSTDVVPQPEGSSSVLLETKTRPEETAVFSALSEVFGAPGFDSAARATVFRETLEELTPRQRQEVLLSLDMAPANGEDRVISDARCRIARLAGTGPAKDGQGPSLLRRLALSESAQSLMLVAEVHWRTQSELAAEASPYA